jgi:hypothetical protein
VTNTFIPEHGNCVGLGIVDRVGRLSLIMTPGAALALGELGVFFLSGQVGAGTAPYVIACLITFMFFTAGGLQVIGWLKGSEAYPLGARGRARRRRCGGRT